MFAMERVLMKRATLVWLPLASLLSVAPVWGQAESSGSQTSDGPAAAATADAPAPATQTQAPADNAPSEATGSLNDAAQEPAPAPAASASANTNAANTTLIRFQFDGVPYTEVVQRYAQAAGKPLVGDLNIEGTLTFFDAEPYTLDEALDALNLILSMKGYVLIDTGRYLRLAPVAQLPQLPLRFLRGLDDTGDIRPGEIVSVVLPLKHIDPKETSEAVSKMLSPAGSIAPLTRGGGIIVTDRLSTIRRIREVIEQLDGQSPSQRQMKTYSLLHSSGGVVADLINRTFGSATAPRRTIWNNERKRFDELEPNPEDYITAVYDEASRTLVMFGPGDRIELAEELIKRFEDESGARAGEVKIFYPRRVRAEELARIIREAIPGVLDPARPQGPRRGRGPNEDSGASLEARIIVDAATNRLIVSAPVATQLTAIEKLIEQVDGTATAGREAETVSVTRIIPVENGNVEELATIVEQATSDRAVPGQPLSRVAITMDKRSNSLIVTGSPRDVAQAQQIVEQLNAKQKEQPRRVQVFALETAAADTIAATVQRVMTEESAGRADVRPPLVLPDNAGNRLIVTATEEQLARIGRIIEEVDRPTPQAQRELRIIPVQHQDASQVAPLVTQLLAEQTKGRPSHIPPANITPDDANSRLIVLATAEDIQRIEAIIAQLNDESTTTTRDQTRVFRLQTAAAQELAPIVTQVASNGLPANRVQVLVDQRSNALVVTGPKEAVEAAEQLISQLDVGNVRPPRQPRIVELEAGDAAHLAPLVTQLFTSMMRDQYGPSYQVEAQITADAPSNRLIVNASDEDWKRIEPLIRQLDKVTERAAGTRVFKLTKGNAAQLAPIVTEAMTTYDRFNRPIRRGTVSADPSTNSLIVTGSSTDLQAAAVIIEQLDGGANQQPRLMRTIDLEHTNAAQIAPLAMQMWNDQTKNRRDVGEVTITADPANNRLIVVSQDEQFEAVKALVAKLDQRNTARPTRTLHSIELKEHAAAHVAAVATQLYKDQGGGAIPNPASILPDTNGNRLLLIATDEEAAVIRQIVESIEAQPARSEAMKQRQVRTITLERSGANATVAVLRQIFAKQIEDANPAERLVLTPGPDDRTLVLEASPATLEEVQALVRSLDRDPATGEVQLRSYRLLEANAAELAQNLGRLYAAKYPGTSGGQQPRFEAEQASNTLLVAATPAQFEQVEALIHELQTSVEVASQTRTFKLSHAEAAQVATVLDSMLSAAQPQPRFGRGGRGPVTPDIPVRVASAPAMNAVVVQGPPEKLAIAEQLVATLDQPEAQGSAQIQAVRLSKAQAVSLAVAVTQAIAARQPQDPARRVSVTPEPNSNSLLVNGPAEGVEQVIQIIRGLDEESTGGAIDVRIYQIQNGQAKELSQTLGTLLRDIFAQQAARNPGMVVPPLSVSADTRTNSVIVSTSSPQFKLVEQLIARLDEGPQRIERDVEYVFLNDADAMDVATQMRALFGDRPAGEAPIIEVDFLGNALTVIARPADMQEVLAAIEKFDKAVGSASVQVRVIPVAPMQVETFVATVVKLYEQMSDTPIELVERLPRPGEAQGEEGQKQRRVLIAPDLDANALVVSAPRRDLDAIQSLVFQLSLSETAGEAEFRVFKVQRADPVAVAQTLDELFNPRLRPDQVTPERRGNREGGNRDNEQVVVVAPPPKITVVPEPRTRSLIVRAKPNDFPVVETLLRELDQVATVVSEVRVFTLKNTDATEVANNLRELFQLAAASTAPSAARGTQARRAQTLRETLLTVRPQVTEDGERAPQPRTDEQPEGEANAAEAEALAIDSSSLPTVTANRATNSIVVAGPAAVMVVVEQIVQELDQSAAMSTMPAVRMYPLKHAQVTATVESLREIFSPSARQAGRGSGAGQPRPPIVISGNEAGRVVIASAPPDEHDLIARVIDDLDQAQAQQSTTVKVYRLRYAQAATAATALSQSMASPGGAAQPAGRRGPAGQPGSGSDLSISADPSSNALVVRASAEDHDRIATLLRELDNLPGDNLPVRLITLRNADPVRVAQVLTRAFGDQRGGAQRGRGAAGTVPGSVVIESDTRSRTLMVRADDATFDQIQALAMQLDETSSAATGVYIMPLTNGNAADVAVMVRELHDQMARSTPGGMIDPLAVTVDQRANALLLATTQPVYEQVSQWIAKVEQMKPARGTSRVLRIQHADPAEVEQAIRDLFGPSSGAAPAGGAGRGGRGAAAGRGAAPANTGTGSRIETTVLPQQRSIIVNANDEDYQTIMQLLAVLDQAAGEAKPQLRVFQLQHASNTRVAQALTATYSAAAAARPQERVTVTALPQSDAIVVAAPASRMEEVAQLIAQLDTEATAMAPEFRVFRLENATPSKILPVLNPMLADVRQATGSPITAQADDRTQSLIITARGRAFEEVEKIIRTLDQAPAYANADVMIVPLKFTDAARMAQVLTSMLQPTLNANTLTPEARALQEQVRRLRIHTGDESLPELDLTKPIRVIGDPTVPNQPGSNRLIISSTPDNLRAMKAVVELMDRMPLTQDGAVRVMPLKHADAQSVMTLLREVFTQGKTLAGRPGTPTATRAEPGDPAGKGLVDPLNVSADLRTNTLVITGTAESLALAESIVQDLDKHEGKFTTEVRLFQLQHTDAAQVAPLLQAVFTEVPTTPPGADGLRTQVTRLRTVLEGEKAKESDLPRSRPALTIRAVPSSQTVIVAARSDVMPLIADVIKSMDIPGPRDRNGVRMFPLQNAEATRVKTIIDSLYTGANAASTRPEDRPNVAVDSRTNVLIVSASDKTFAVIEALLQDLDRQLPIELRDIRLVTLKNAEAGPLALVLQQMMDARVTRQQALGIADAESLRVIIAADPRSNALIVGGSNEGYELVKALAQQLDEAGPALKGQVQLLPLKHANAGTLASSLTNLFNQRYAAAATPDVQRQRPVILPDLRSNSLLVVANADDTTVLKQLLTSLDVELTDPAVRLEVLPLRHNDAAVVGPMIQQIFAARLQSMTPPGQPPAPQDRVDVATNSLANALIVSASGENLAMIRELLAKVDIEPPTETGVVKLFALKNSDATRVQTMLQSMISQGLYKPGNAASNDPLVAARERVSIVADTRTNVLIVSASKENLAVISEVISKIDSSEDYHALSDMRVYVLKQASAVRLAPTLQQLFTAKRQAEIAAGGTGRSLPTSVIADARTNALLVTGSRESFAAIDELIMKLDGEAGAPAAIFRVFELKQATAASVAPMLQQLFAQRAVRGNNVDPVSVIAEPKTNTLIVSASPEDMLLAEEMIQRLDAPDRAPGISTRVFALAKADASQVASTVQQLFTQQAGGSAGVSISVDQRLNAIVASGGAADLHRIGELVKQLDTETVTKVTEIRVFALRNADAVELADILMTALTNRGQGETNYSPNRQTLLQFVTTNEDGQELIASALQDVLLITPDRRTNTLVVKAPVESMPLLQRLIHAMDSTSPRMAKVRVFKLKNADARQMSDVLQQLFRLQAGTAGGANQAISYTLVAPGEGEGSPAGTPVASAVVGSAEQYALSVTVDVRTNSLLVGGTDGYVALASSIIEELDSSPAQERKTQVYRLRNSQAVDIQNALRSFLDQERQRLIQTLGTDGIGAAQRLLEQEVAVVAEPATNTLLISASPRYFDTVMTMVKELDQAPPQVLIQVLLAEVTLDDRDDLGFEWQYTKGLNDTLGTGRVGTNFGVASDFQRMGGFAMAVTGGDLTFMLRALQSKGRMQVLSRPQVLASDNQPATVQVGQRVPFVTNSRISDQGSVLNSIAYEDVGIILNVTPRINDDGFVKLDVAPEISSISDSTIQISEGLNATVFNNRSAQTTVSVQDGHTIIIGGLITTSDTTRVDKVPLVGDIPGLGLLFQNRTVQSERTELLIILTPYIVRNLDDARRVTEKQVQTLEMLEMKEGNGLRHRALDTLQMEPKDAPAEKAPAQVD